jgi:hypothetical protein
MEYPEDETDLTAEQMTAIMADGEPVMLVDCPLYEVVRAVPSYGGSTVVRSAIAVPVGITIGHTTRQEFALTP